ncbi:potassium-transporting ATPase subunit KdpC [Sorangium sp. So ce448]|uniref:potassium-transporting ATPase subunit KdpC n=1 Tax=Sorangium sp. So ce448 TaxID=3133314 RepID=UPI003F5ECAD1
MLAHLRPALVLLLVLTGLTGFAYPLLSTAVAQAAFPHQANGSLVVIDGGRVVGSSLLGQAFNASHDPRYFWGRPSATSPVPYAGQASSGSNLGPTNPALAEAVKARIEALRAADPEAAAPVPVDLVTASGSGLDPHISPAAAEYQVRRVARARNLGEDEVRRLVARHTEGRFLGLLGEPHVNVLLLNLALDGAR